MVSSAATTVTTNSFSPVTRSVSPEIETVASASVVSTATSTVSVRYSRLITSPGVTVTSLIVIFLTVASSLNATFKVT